MTKLNGLILILLNYNLFLTCCGDSGHTSVDNYGPYVVIWKKLELCQGPKKETIITATLTFDNKTDKLYVVANVTSSCVIAQAKVATYSIKENVKKKTLFYNIKKPCEHFALGPILTFTANLTTTCLLKKAIYTQTVQVTDMIKSFYGQQFFYGDYEVKVMLLTKLSNVVCFDASVSFVKKI